MKITDKILFVLLVTALLCVMAASFLPYSVELLLSIAAAELVGAVLLLQFARVGHSGWFLWTALLPCGLSVALTLIMLVGHKLTLCALIAAVDLLIIAAMSVWGFMNCKMPRVPLGVMLSVCLLFSFGGALSHIVFSRSVMATVAEWVVASRKTPDEGVAEVFKKLTEDGERPFAVDQSDFDALLVDDSFEGMRVLYVNPDADYDHVIFYIHGGYYVYQASGESMAMMNRLAKATNSMVVIPVYPLAPFASSEENYPVMMELYAKVRRENEGKKIILMGDSAGGGYSLALAEGMSANGLEQPDEMILMSPWVDLSMSNPEMSDYAPIDPMLTVTMGIMSGKAWAGSLPVKDWHVSPINGEISDIKNTTIYLGTRELFYPDVSLLYDKLSGNPGVVLIVGKGQNHCYPLYPTLEGRIASEEIIQIIQR